MPIISVIDETNLQKITRPYGFMPIGPNNFDNIAPNPEFSFETAPWFSHNVDARDAIWGPSAPGLPYEFRVLNRIRGGNDCIWRGGKVIGTFPAATSWERMHDAYAMTVENHDAVTIIGYRAHNTGDGISLNAGANQPIIFKCHFSFCRDDAFQNDFHNANVTIEDCLIDGCFVFFSSRPYQTGLPNSSGVIPTRIEKCLVRLTDMPTTFLNNGLPGHGRFFKMDKSASPIDPKLQLVNNIFRVDTPHVCCGDFMMPPASRIDVCTGNIMVWGGQGAWPYPTEAGWTVTTDTTVWDNARRAWLDDPVNRSIPGLCDEFLPPA